MRGGLGVDWIARSSRSRVWTSGGREGGKKKRIVSRIGSGRFAAVSCVFDFSSVYLFPLLFSIKFALNM
jgi:hypothetical protein